VEPAVLGRIEGVGANPYTYDADDRLGSDQYDADGNTTNSGGTANAYDFENHMTQHGLVTLVYDGDVALGYTAAFGTLMPPIFRGVFRSEVLGTRSGLIVLGGVAVCLLGITFAGAAGVSKEREMSIEQKRASIKEFALKKGLLVATFSGVMSACFAYGLAAGDPIKAIVVKHGTPGLWQGLPVLVVLLAGGFTTNFIWCVILNVRNRTGYQYFEARIRGRILARSEEHILEAVTDAPAEEMAVALAIAPEGTVPTPLLANYLFSILAGTTWYMQFFFYTMGETQMGRYKFSSWTLHMASIIIFSTLWGIALKEWKGASGRTWLLVAASLVVLVSSTVIVGYGNYVSGERSSHLRHVNALTSTARGYNLVGE
jgi:L-rhamnose-H+ transport protein